MDYLNMDKDIFYSLVNMKLRDFYDSLEDFCISEGLDYEMVENKIICSGFIYDSNLNRLIFS